MMRGSTREELSETFRRRCVVRKFFLPLAAIVAVTAFPVSAAETIWLDSDHSSYSGYYPSGSALTFAGSDSSVQATAWSVHSDGTIRRAQLGIWEYGLGVRNGAGDNSHTIDNWGYYDFILLQFDRVVALKDAQFQTGWHQMNDTDAVIGYKTSAIPYGGILPYNNQPQSALSSFNLYQSGQFGNSGDSFRNINLSGNSGNLWLIGASFSNPEGRRNYDGFKLESVSFVATGAVPEPSTWAMMLIGFLGIGGVIRSQRRKQKTMVSYA